MKEPLRDLLTPADDGRGFTDAVLMRASGALHRRRQRSDATEPVWSWLGAWARPWLIAALVVLALLGVVPALPPSAPVATAEPVTPTEAVATLELPPEFVAIAVPEPHGERE